MQLEIWDRWIPKPQRKDDRVIMDVHVPHFSERELLMIQQCRIYLQALTLADIASEDGTTITKVVWNVTSSPADGSYRLQWPYQH